MSMSYIAAKNGFKIPALGLGTWQAPKGEVCTAVKAAIDIGYRHIDCAYAYGNENEVGEAIAAKLAEGVVKREDLFVTSKLWNTFHRPDLVKKACQESLEKLQLSYLDLYLIHWPMAYVEDREPFPKDENGQFIFSEVDYMDTWKAMEELVDAGLVRAIGVSNFNRAQLDRILSGCRIAPACLQIESSPYLANQRLAEFAQSRGVAVVAYSPLGSPNRPWAKPGDPQLLEEPLLREIGAAHGGKTPAQVVLRWQLDRGLGVIPKSVRPERLRENLNVMDFSLTKEEVEKIAAFNKDYRAVSLTWVSHHKYYPFSDPY